MSNQNVIKQPINNYFILRTLILLLSDFLWELCLLVGTIAVPVLMKYTRAKMPTPKRTLLI